MSFQSFEERLDNWGRVVTSYGGGGNGASTWWAELYVKLRDARHGSPRPAVINDHADGWLVESAWQAMPDHVFKWVLKYHYVFRMGAPEIQTTMWRRHETRVRRDSMLSTLANARVALAREITTITGKDVVENLPRLACKLENPFL